MIFESQSILQDIPSPSPNIDTTDRQYLLSYHLNECTVVVTASSFMFDRSGTRCSKLHLDSSQAIGKHSRKWRTMAERLIQTLVPPSDVRANSPSSYKESTWTPSPHSGHVNEATEHLCSAVKQTATVAAVTSV